jgi:hypothetical protein
MRALEYAPFGKALANRPHVFVDGLRAPGTVLELSHWPGNRTPVALKGDVSVQAVLALLHRPDDERERLLAGAQAVTCDHYDLDGLLSVFCLTRPGFALKHSDLLAGVALCDDFDIYTATPAVQACLAMLHAERDVRFQQHASVGQATTALFTAMLDLVEECLLDPAARRHGWADEWADITRSAHYLDQAPSALVQVGDVAILRDTDEPLHEYAVHARTTAGHVLRLRQDGRHSLRFRYESFVDLRTRQAAPRVRGDVLADRLNSDERNGVWFCESPATATPLLQLYRDDAVPASSSHDQNELERRVLAFFLEARGDESLLWRPHSEWIHEAPGTPPSKETA